MNLMLQMMTRMAMTNLLLVLAVLAEAGRCYGHSHSDFNPNVTVTQCSGDDLVVHLEDAAEGGSIHIKGQGSHCKHMTTDTSKHYIFNIDACKIKLNKMFRVHIQKNDAKAGSGMVVHIICVNDVTRNEIYDHMGNREGSKEYKTSNTDTSPTDIKGTDGHPGKVPPKLKHPDVTASKLHVGDSMSTWFDLAMSIKTDAPEQNSTPETTTSETTSVAMTTDYDVNENLLTSPVTTSANVIDNIEFDSANEVISLPPTTGYIISTTYTTGTPTESTTPSSETSTQVPMTSTTVTTTTEELHHEPVISTTALTTTLAPATTTAQPRKTVSPAVHTTNQHSHKTTSREHVQNTSHRSQTMNRLYRLLREYKRKFIDKSSRKSNNHNNIRKNNSIIFVNSEHGREGDSVANTNRIHVLREQTKTSFRNPLFHRGHANHHNVQPIHHQGHETHQQGQRSHERGHQKHHGHQQLDLRSLLRLQSLRTGKSNKREHTEGHMDHTSTHMDHTSTHRDHTSTHRDHKPLHREHTTRDREHASRNFGLDNHFTDRVPGGHHHRDRSHSLGGRLFMNRQESHAKRRVDRTRSSNVLKRLAHLFNFH